MSVPKPPGGPPVVTRVWLRVAASLLVLAAFSHATATMLVHLSLERLASAADTIVEGRVEAVRSFWEGRQIVTEVTLSVWRALKGHPGARVSFLQVGGSVQAPVPATMTVPGAPIHSVGDEGFYFLEPGGPGREIVVGLSQGRVPERRDEAGLFVGFDGRRRTPGQFADDVRRALAGQPPAAPMPPNGP
jgi:hypothetical protein